MLTLVIGEDGRYTNASVFDDDGSAMVFEAGEVFGSADTVYFVNDLEALARIPRQRSGGLCLDRAGPRLYHQHRALRRQVAAQRDRRTWSSVIREVSTPTR